MKQENILRGPVEQTALHNQRSVGARKQAAEELTLLCIADSLSDASQRRIKWILSEPVNWKHMLEMIAFHGVVSLVAHNLIANGFSASIPQYYLNKLTQAYNHTMYRNMVLTGELSDVLSIFNQQGIMTIVLKGTALAEDLYGNPALRMVADIDVLVHTDDIPLAETAIMQLGYKRLMSEELERHPFHGAPFYKEGSFPFFLELHRGLEDSSIIDIPEEAIWNRADMQQLQGLAITVLSPEDNLLFLANNLSKNDDQWLKLLGDIAQLLKKYEASLDWKYVIEAAHSWRIETAVYMALRYAVTLLGAPIPGSSLEAMKPGRWRRWFLALLLNEETLVSSIRRKRLRAWTTVFARSLMLSNPKRILAVLSRHHGSNKRAGWLKALFWTIPVFSVSLWHYRVKLTTGHVRRGEN